MKIHLDTILSAGATVLLTAAPAAALGGNPKQQVHEIYTDGWMRSGWSDAEVVEELVAVGPGAIPSLFDIHAGQDFGPWKAEGAGLDFERGPEQGARLAGLALASLPGPRVVAFLNGRVRTKDPAPARLATLGLYSALGAGDELSRCLDLVASFSEEERLRDVAIRRRLPADLAALFENAPSAALEAASSFADIDEGARGIVVEAFFLMEHPVGLDALPVLLGKDAKLDVRVVGRLSELGHLYPWRLYDDHAVLARDLLKQSSWTARRAACVLAANWHQHRLFPQLVALFENDPQPAVQRSALWALHELSRTKLDLDAKGWMGWYGTQRHTWDEEVDRLADDLRSGEPGVVTEAMRRLSQFPLHRHEAAELIVSVLPRHLALADTFASVLIELDSRHVVPQLVDALEGVDDERARELVWRTLKHLTERDLAIDDPSWTELAFD